MARQVESVEDLAEMVRDDPALAREIQSRPAEAIAELAAPLQRDVCNSRFGGGALSLVAVLPSVVATLVAVATHDTGVPDAVVALGSAAVGALAGLLAPQAART